MLDARSPMERRSPSRFQQVGLLGDQLIGDNEMPKRKRDQLLRFHDQGKNNLDRFIGNMKSMYDMYDPTHPNHATMVTQLAEIAENLKGMLTQFRNDMM